MDNYKHFFEILVFIYGCYFLRALTETGKARSSIWHFKRFVVSLGVVSPSQFKSLNDVSSGLFRTGKYLFPFLLTLERVKPAVMKYEQTLILSRT